MKSTYPWPPLPSKSDWSKLDQIRDDIKATRQKLNATKSCIDRISSGSDGRMGIDRMVQTVRNHDRFIDDRNGPFGRLFRWFQTR